MQTLEISKQTKHRKAIVEIITANGNDNMFYPLSQNKCYMSCQKPPLQYLIPSIPKRVNP